MLQALSSGCWRLSSYSFSRERGSSKDATSIEFRRFFWLMKWNGDLRSSDTQMKTSLVDITELSANPHELGGNPHVLGGPCSWENEDLSCGEKEKKEVDFDRRSSLDRIPIIASLFECWIFGLVLEITVSHAASCVAERSRVKKLYASV
ncbi:hypothetical protein AVEN_150023-1 [Araneus ventricosus]|uniref:Uncharacterized protein n=1 Tax=Araneus ventricosus TaxID=182803 RepID=A0A4Y2K3N4_ARAVE|nr:hypothetical protein AVEN_150023-1 [Araneus ventricosus]